MLRVAAKLPVLILIFSIASPKNAFPEPEKIRLGVISALTGPVAEWGVNTTQGMTLALDEVNREGGIKGSPLELIFEDFELMNLKKAAAAAHKLVEVDKVRVLLTQWSEDTEVGWPIARQSGILTFTYNAGATDITKNKDLLFRIWPADDALVRKIIQYAAKENGENPCVITMQSAYFYSMRVAAEQEWTRINGKPPLVVEHPTDITDVRPYVLRLRTCSSIAALTQESFLSLFFKELQRLHNKALLITHWGITSEAIRREAGTSITGVIFGAYPYASPDFRKKFIERYKRPPGVPAASAYDSIKVLAYAMNKQGTSTAQIVSGLEAVKNFPGATGAVEFTPDHDRAGITPQLWRITAEGHDELIE